MIKDKPIKEIVLKEAELYEYKGADQVVPASVIAETLSHSKDAIFKFKTGIPSMDRILDGVECGELILVTGLPGDGKTTFLMTITRNMALLGVKSIWFTLEVTPSQFLEKMSMKDTMPEFYMPADTADNSLKWIEERVVESRAKYGTKVIFIDHINMIYSLDQYKGNTSLELGDMVAKLKQIAIKYNQIIFLVAHGRDPDTQTMKEPTQYSVRDSGMIIRLADTVMGIWRVKNNSDPLSTKLDVIDENDNQSKIRIWKNRRVGKRGFFFMEHKDHYLTEIDKNANLNNFVGELKKEKLF